ncbi:hypothetical protein GCM10017783_14230 [Deinococcus piscis]|uniref:PEP-CTERM sorting domain-containing protein n=1 Tax=Deinococcus piscis TaxID=394230 RepID=A0ABQ3K4S7_9DEIO|nr:hypothetical protein GCM10017783_14230 [Deinococcus piscis]
MWSLLLGLCITSGPAQAAISQVNYTLTFDGVSDADGAFDPKAGPGFDTGPNNAIVRTNDLVEYTVALG